MKVRIPSPATMIAAIALLFALSGTAVAGVLVTSAQIQNNTVSSLDVRNNNLKSIDVRNNTLTTLDVRNGTLRKVDFAPGVLGNGGGAAGPAGPAGQQGPQGPQGVQGAPGLSGLEIVSAETASNSDSPKQIEASCPAGKQVVGGGAHIFNAATDAALDESYPASATTWRGTAWEVVATAANWKLRAYAICATIPA